MSTQAFLTCTGILASACLLCCSSADVPTQAALHNSAAGATSSAAGASPSAAGASSLSNAGAPGASGSGGASGGSSGAAGGTLGVTLPTGNPISAGGGDPASGGAAPTGPVTWTLAWSDEFNGPDGSPVDATKWTHELGGDGFGNQELEYYTDETGNSQQKGGNLVITTTKDGAASHTCWNGACQYTSARLVTTGHYTTTYGKIEARIKIPTGKGVWPAFWMLGSNIKTVSWPTCGELDIMENIGSEPTIVHGSMHGPGYSGANPLTGQTTLPNSANLSDDFHIYSIEWAPDVVRFYLDNALYETRTPADMPDGALWVYNRPFFILLNVAVGGPWAGPPDATASFPTQMLVDYVHVYAAK